MVNLSASGQTIRDQLTKSSTLAAGATYYAGVGGIIESGTMTQAQIDQAMVDSYNSALNTVLTTEYFNSKILLEQQANVTMSQLSAAVDNLASAATVLAIAGVVSDMAANVATSEDAMQVQSAISVLDAELTQQDVDNYNNALTSVETLAQSAAGYLAASRDVGVTGAIDNYAASNNISMSSYSSVTFSVDQQNMDFLTITFAGGYGIGLMGDLQAEIKTADEVWTAGTTYGMN